MAYANRCFQFLFAISKNSLLMEEWRKYNLSYRVIRQSFIDAHIYISYIHNKPIWIAKVNIDCAVILHRSIKNKKSEQISYLPTSFVTFRYPVNWLSIIVF